MVTFATAKTAQELRDASVLNLCYANDAIEAFIAHRDRDGLLAALLAIQGADACWALAAWLPREKRTEWADGSARRAKEYAAVAAASRAASRAAASAYASAYASHASAAAAYAERSAAYAAYAAAAAYAERSAAARAAEFEIAVRHGVLLLTGEA